MPHSIRSSPYKTKRGKPKTRRKFQDTKQLSITSLLDILTIMLVFLIKNVSMDAANVTTPENMTLPFTILNEKLIEDNDPLVIKMYPDQILMGKSNARIGSLDDLTDDGKYRRILAVLEHEAELIAARGTDNIPVMLIQADKTVKCFYISEMMRLAGEGGYQYVYFSSAENKAWLTEYAKGM